MAINTADFISQNNEDKFVGDFLTSVVKYGANQMLPLFNTSELLDYDW